MTKRKTKLGRKPVADKKEPVAIYVYRSEIKKVGGKDSARDILTQSWAQHMKETRNCGEFSKTELE
jgi:hypothetical protein